MSATSETLRAVPLFQGMTDRSIGEIAGLASEADFQPGTPLVREGDPGDTFIVIVDGRATVERHSERIGEMSAGDFLGEISLIDGGPRSATVTTVDPIHALVIECDGFRRLMDSYPPVRMDILTALTMRLRRDAPSVSD